MPVIRGQSLPSPVLGLQALRGAAMILVFLFHFLVHWAPFSGQVNLPRWWAAAGGLGTNTFLVLSGLAVNWSLSRGTVSTWKDFMTRRFWRIYPPYLAVLGLYLLAGLIAPQYSKLPDDFVDRAIYCLRSLILLPGIFPERPAITASWTLSLLGGFYCVAPILAAFARRLSPATAAFLLSLCGIGCMYWMPAPLGRGAFLLFGFAAGFLLRADPPPLPSRQRIAMLAVSLLLLRASLDAVGSPLFPVLQTLGILGAIVALSRWPGTANGLLEPLAFLGDRSYSFYLVHGVAIKVFFDFILPRNPGIQPESLFAAAFVTALGCAVMLYRLVERPAHSLRIPGLPVIFLEPVERRAARAE